MTATTIILQGMGQNNLLVTRGYGAFEQQVIALAQELVQRRRGGSKGRPRPDDRDEYDVLIGARVLLINGLEPPEPIRGFVRVSFSPTAPPRVRVVESSSQVSQSRIVIRVKKVKAVHGRD